MHRRPYGSLARQAAAAAGRTHLGPQDRVDCFSPSAQDLGPAVDTFGLETAARRHGRSIRSHRVPDGAAPHARSPTRNGRGLTSSRPAHDAAAPALISSRGSGALEVHATRHVPVVRVSCPIAWMKLATLWWWCGRRSPRWMMVLRSPPGRPSSITGRVAAGPVHLRLTDAVADRVDGMDDDNQGLRWVRVYSPKAPTAHRPVWDDLDRLDQCVMKDQHHEDDLRTMMIGSQRLPRALSAAI